MKKIKEAIHNLYSDVLKHELKVRNSLRGSINDKDIEVLEMYAVENGWSIHCYYVHI